MKSLFQLAESTGKQTFLQKLMATNLGPKEMRAALDAYPGKLADGDNGRSPAPDPARAAQAAREHQLAKQQAHEDEKIRIEAERRWRSLRGLPPLPQDYRTEGERELHGAFASIARDASRGHDPATERALYEAGAAAGRQLWSGRPQDPLIDQLRAAAERRAGG